MTRKLVLLVALCLSGCKNRHPMIVKDIKLDESETTRVDLTREEVAVLKTLDDEPYKTLRAVEDSSTWIKTVEFDVKATAKEMDYADNGIIHWISLDKTSEEILALRDAEEIVVPNKKVTLVLDYPLARVVFIPLTTTRSGFTRRDLAMLISQHYHTIYAEEEASAKQRTIPVDQRKGLINRNETDGKYGIWGHDLSDLDMSSVDVRIGKDGIIYILPGIES